MFGIFSKKSEEDKLNKRYQKLMLEAHQYSTINRSLSDKKVAEANRILEFLNTKNK